MLCTCPPRIRGSSPEILSSPTRVGCPYPEFFLAGHQSSSDVDLRFAFSVGLDGAGITGIMIGTATARFTTTTPTSPIAAPSSIAIISITTAAILTTAMHFMEADPEAEIQDSTVLCLLMRSPERTPAHSVDSITAEIPEAFPLADSPALGVDPMAEAASTAVVASIAAGAATGGAGTAVAATSEEDIGNHSCD